MTGSIDTMFAQLVTGNVWASTIAGFIFVLIILFLAIGIFGRNKVQLDAFGITFIVFIASIIATVVGLFPSYVLLVILILSLVSIIIKTLFFGGSNGQ